MPPTPATPPAIVPHLVELAGPGVQISKLDQRLMAALAPLARLHVELFNKPLVVTSGNDGDHSKGSKHYANQAVDLRARDKGPAEQLLFGLLLADYAQRFNLAVFDERARDKSPHWHVELAD